MTREQFIRGYCERSHLPCKDHQVMLGYVELGDWQLLVLPCVCGEEGCHGWGVVSVDGFETHMRFHAPQELRQAYLKSLGEG